MSLFSSALVASLVGYGASVAILLAAARSLGASPAETASWLLAICLAKAVGSAFLSWQSRVPVVLAWSTPGAALIAASEGIGMAEAVGAFLLAGGLIALTGAWGPLGRLIARIPDAIAAAMLAGVLLPFCLTLPGAAQSDPMLVLPMIVVFALVRLRNPAMAVLAALALGIGLAFLTGEAAALGENPGLPGLVLIWPDWSAPALIGLGLPLYLVTMASQNLPGFATLRAAGYAPPVRPALLTTGGLSALTALAGAHTTSMAAITAAICLGEDTHPDRSQRWKVGLAYGLVWLLLGLFGAFVLALLEALPPGLLAAVVALALLGPLMGAASAAFATPEQRFPALVTLVVTGAGLPVLGIGAAFWGLVAGIALYALDHWHRRSR
ncbi:benzoate/H(+) symporter BenE family transporter [Szabonella alba]|uniref:benzoate/H(+) symporter BenE family transporter n=1 Tax=Szabonella alba TaxID=2804194 RepID=UPI001F02207B|nr:benzoate/H(+) symporter BenE family transporter [Szabonella alba]